MQWRNNNFAAVPHWPTAADGGRRRRSGQTFEKIVPNIFRQKMTFSSRNRFLQHFELIAANLQLFEAFDKILKKKKFEKKKFFENFNFLRPSSNAAAPHARIAEILITPLVRWYHLVS